MTRPNTFAFFVASFLLATCLSLPSHAHEQAALYSVQVGAFASPAQGFRESLTQYGSVTVDNSGALARFLVGNFKKRSEAELLRDELQREGFGDAFVRSIGVVTDHAHESGPVASEQARIDALSEEQRNNVVYLDGVLHLKNGDSFVPLK